LAGVLIDLALFLTSPGQHRGQDHGHVGRKGERTIAVGTIVMGLIGRRLWRGNFAATKRRDSCEPVVSRAAGLT
jgi:hypothetical protein